jgi:phosphoribosylglycinamide formyltransferase-1
LTVKRIAVFASGNGSNFEAIVEACEQGRINAAVVLLVCDRAGAYVCERAARHGVETFVFSPKDYASKADYEAEIVRLLDGRAIDLVCLAGYMRMLSGTLLSAYEGRIINIHPSLLPAFKGAHAIRDAFEYGVKVYGVTVHWVDSTMDGGRIISQRAFPYDGCDIVELETKIHAVEHELYIDTINKLLQ